MGRSLWVVGWVLFLPVGVAAQTGVDTTAPPEAGPSLSLVGDPGAGLPRLGVWRPVSERLRIGFEIESDVRSWTIFPRGEASRKQSGSDWRFAAGPSAAWTLARTGAVRLYGYGHLSVGSHAFDVTSELRPGDSEAGFGVGAQVGVGLDWQVSERWSAGVLYAGRWTSSPGTILGAERSRWRSPHLGVSVRFRF